MSSHPGWLLLVVGLLIAGIGAIWLLAPAIPWLGQLPGDIRFQWGRFRFYFPLATCLLLSLLLTSVAWIVRYLAQ